MITVTCAYVVVFLPDEASKLRGGVVASFGYVTNWYLIFHQQSYFSSLGRQPMLQHLWSLAIEEQFYLLWPLLLGLALKFWRPSRIKLAVTIFSAAAASALLMALLYRAGGDPSRVYYGTDTHSSGLLIGAGMAVLLPPWQLRGRIGKRAPMALDVIGLTGLLVLVWCFVNVNEFDSSLYRGGYLVFACVVALVVLVAVHPATTITGGLLGTSPMVWIGKRSYGIYLWHWPVFLVTRPGVDIPLTGIPLFTFRVAITVGLAAASYRFVEVPIRSGALGRRLSALRHTPCCNSDASAPGSRSPAASSWSPRPCSASASRSRNRHPGRPASRRSRRTSRSRPPPRRPVRHLPRRPRPRTSRFPRTRRRTRRSPPSPTLGSRRSATPSCSARKRRSAASSGTGSRWTPTSAATSPKGSTSSAGCTTPGSSATWS